MFRSCLPTSAPHIVASSSHSLLHTSAALNNVRLTSKPVRHEKTSKVQARINHKLAFDAQREYAVLGHRPGQNHKWQGCDLANAIITEDALYSDSAPQIVRTLEGDIELPPHLNYGIDGEARKQLFEELPLLSAQKGVTKFSESVVSDVHEAMEKEKAKAMMFATVVDLRNANAKGKPHDTGRPEVQAALLTIQIRGLWKHLLSFRKDINNRRGLRHLVHKRANILKYLKRLDRDRYEAILPRLGLDAASVEGELVV